MTFYENVKRLVQYGIETGLIPEEERIYATNQLLELFGEDEYTEPDAAFSDVDLEEVLTELLDYAAKKGILKENSVVCRDLFDTKIMNCLVPRPAQVIGRFRELYAQSPQAATDYYYKLSQDSDYIRRYRISKDMRWKVDSPYGEIDISINLSKPEKDPKAIAAAKAAKQSGYPKCLLCMENIGYAGRVDHPARQNHRVIPVTINGTDWGFQYSPYVYYNEHCIVFNGQHVPMKIERATFVKLFDFIKLFPHYFLGSNADLPIVGGSILSHDHYQGGNYQFAMAKAPIERQVVIAGYEDVETGIVKWPLSVLRIRSKDETRLIDLADHVLAAWRGYADEKAGIFAETNGELHNTITPIARKVGDVFELDLALRNNITTEEYPMGVFHPHPDKHNIKKENIGLIEVMGLAILPARLKKELQTLAEYIVEKKDIRSNPEIEKHAEWVKRILPKYPDVSRENVMDILKKEVGYAFTAGLEDAGVYKCTPEGREAFMRFVGVYDFNIYKEVIAMRILVTGGAGYIGSHTCVELLNEGYEVVVVDNLYNASKKSLERVEQITGKSVTFYETDIRDREGLEAVFAKESVDAVIHFAGLKAVGESVSKPIEYYQNNIAGTLTLCDVMRKHGVKNIIFSSSATIYGDPAMIPITEECPKGVCTNPYGWTKWMLEQVLIDIQKSDPEWNVILLRYFNPIGAHKSGLIGEDPKGIPNNLLPYVAQVAIGKLECLGVFGDDYDTPDGTGVRDYIHVVDLARGHVKAIQKLADKEGVNIYNLGTGNGYSVLQVVHAFEKACGHPIKYQIKDRRPGDIAQCYCDPAKAKQELGWVAEYGIEEMCADSWRWQSQNPNGYND